MQIDTPKSPPDLAKLIGVKSDTVRAWINAGLLEAVNVADPSANRPRWRIMPDAWESFMLSRSSRLRLNPIVKRKQRAGKKPKLRYCQL